MRRSAAARGYGHRWRKARGAFLAAHPLCAYCERRGRVVAASVVDHIEPHRGDPELFWDQANWQALCQRCHDRDKQREELGAPILGCGLDGMPLDPRHAWNRDAA